MNTAIGRPDVRTFKGFNIWAARQVAFQMIEFYKLNDVLKTDLKQAQDESRSKPL